jgi:hypothetical protein
VLPASAVERESVGPDRQGSAPRATARSGPHDLGGLANLVDETPSQLYKTARADALRMVCVRGTDRGREFTLVPGTLTVGREPSGQIVLKDPSVSRMHAQVVVSAEGIRVTDHGSANGTYVNEVRISNQALFSGDEVAFGTATFRIEGLSESQIVHTHMSSVAGMSWGRRAAIGGLALGLLSGTLLALLLVWQMGQARADPKALFQSFSMGITDYRERRWLAAEKHFRTVVDLDPSRHEAHLYLDAAGGALAAELQLRKAWDARKRGDIEAAVKALWPVRTSPLADDARTLLADLHAEIERMAAAAKTGKERREARRLGRKLAEPDE